jgi:hypothetical protein
MSEPHLPMRMWFDGRDMEDAPSWLGAEEACAWADGWNTAVRACFEYLALAFQAIDPVSAKELSLPIERPPDE